MREKGRKEGVRGEVDCRDAPAVMVGDEGGIRTRVDMAGKFSSLTNHNRHYSFFIL